MGKGNAACAVSVPARVVSLWARGAHVPVNAGEIRSWEPGDSAGGFALLFPGTGVL